MKILVTGVAGFIGMHVATRMLARGDEVIGIDNLNDYYDPALKHARLAQLAQFADFRFEKLDIADAEALHAYFKREQPQRVVHLAAQAGVRYSLTHPQAYFQSNLLGFGNMLEACRQNEVEHLVYASSSSVYGANTRIPFSEQHNVDHPVSLYAASKKANELMAHSYSHLYGLPTTGLRYFTVYGPWGRPDMSPWLFTSAILQDQPIQVFNHGEMLRDFTYIDDIVEGTVRVVDKLASAEIGSHSQQTHSTGSAAPYKVFNIGNHTPVKLTAFISTLEKVLGKHANQILCPMQAGDVLATCADVSALQDWVGFEPNTSLEAGLANWVKWYKAYL